MPPFEAHGNPRSQLSDRILYVRPDGPGNAEGVAALLDDMARMLAPAAPGPWAVLLIAEAETLLTPDAERLLQAAMPRLAAAGHAATAVALLCAHGRGLIDAQFRRVHERAGVAFASFESLQAAEDWLRTGLAAGA